MKAPPVTMQAVSGNYFNALEIPLLRGRTFAKSDTHDAPCVVVVNQSLADLVWPGDKSIGKQIDSNGGFGGKRNTCSVIGVSGDARDIAVSRPPEPSIFFSDMQKPASADSILIVRSHRDRSIGVHAVESAVRSADSSRQLLFSEDLGALVRQAVSPAERRIQVLSFLAAVALFLATGGAYAAASYHLSQRTREFGVRVALGARPVTIASLVYRYYSRLLLTGALLGLCLCTIFNRFISVGLALVEKTNDEIGIYVVAAVFCLTVVLFAITIPTVKVCRASPSPLLRVDGA